MLSLRAFFLSKFRSEAEKFVQKESEAIIQCIISDMFKYYLLNIVGLLRPSLIVFFRFATKNNQTRLAMTHFFDNNYFFVRSKIKVYIFKLIVEQIYIKYYKVKDKCSIFNVKDAIFNVVDDIFNVVDDIFNVKVSIFKIVDGIFNIKVAIFNVIAGIFNNNHYI